MFLCAKATIANGRFAVVDGGLTNVGMGESHDLLMIVTGEPHEVGPHTRALEATDADGNPFVVLNDPFNIPAGPFPGASWTARLGPFVKAGRYGFVLRVDGARIADYAFEVH
jgi:hypothetical protein